ncbi:hypothetical protein ACW7GZ_04805 [Luteimonas sp. A537]
MQLRTEIESFQRVCSYTPSGGANGPAFFTVERKGGSIWEVQVGRHNARIGDKDKYSRKRSYDL